MNARRKPHGCTDERDESPSGLIHSVVVIGQHPHDQSSRYDFQHEGRSRDPDHIVDQLCYEEFRRVLGQHHAEEDLAGVDQLPEHQDDQQWVRDCRLVDG